MIIVKNNTLAVGFKPDYTFPVLHTTSNKKPIYEFDPILKELIFPIQQTWYNPTDGGDDDVYDPTLSVNYITSKVAVSQHEFYYTESVNEKKTFIPNELYIFTVHNFTNELFPFISGSLEKGLLTLEQFVDNWNNQPKLTNNVLFKLMDVSALRTKLAEIQKD